MTPLDPMSVPLRGTNLIEASAGTGKTYTITNLYVRLLLELGLSVNEILVVTYTNAATAELRARLRHRLRGTLAALDAPGGSGDVFLDRLAQRRRTAGTREQDRARLTVALHSFDEAAIFTIHGFCQRMLQDNAFESGAPFDAELVSNEGPLVTEVVQDFWIRELHAAPLPLVRRLAEKRITPTTLRDLALMAIAHRDVPVLPERDPAARIATGLAGGPLDAGLLDARVLKLQLDLVDYVRWETRQRKEQTRVQSFDDLLQRLAEALRGAGGATLAQTIRRRFRAALIDEFQDTDPVQYEIFRRVYLGTDAVLFLIGDPKQAIYAFRGADVFAYLQAKRDVGGSPYTLGVNQRSDPSLVAAVRTLFGRLQAPFELEEIPFPPVDAAPDASDRLGGGAAGTPPLEILFVPRVGQQSQDGSINKAWGEGALTVAVAADIVRFLQCRATIADRPLEPSDIAVLCRTNKQASLMQQALRELGVPSVLQGDASVFESPEAEEMERVLRAMADPGDGRAIRAALSTILLGQNAQDLSALEYDEQRWGQWVRQFQARHDRWAQRSFVSAFRALLDAHGVSQRLLGYLDGERRLTNVLHLLELLHAASTEERRGPHALVRWLNQMRTDAQARAVLASEAEQIRLESDAAAVQLTTVHKSKGLQFPIVYCPHLWDGSPLHQRDKALVRFHDPAEPRRLTLDIGSADRTAHVALAEREAFAENLRLLYVALTRARHRCTVVWGPFRSAESSALGYVLHQAGGVDRDPRAATAARIKTFIRSRDDAAMRADLAALAAAAPRSIGVADLRLERVARYTPPRGDTRTLQCRTAKRELRRVWRVSSFSALAASGAALSQPDEEGVDHDALAETAAFEVQPVQAPDHTLVLLHDFPAGARAGQLIHEVLQRLDFRATDAAALRAAVLPALARFDVADSWAQRLCDAIGSVLATPLDDAAQPLCLGDVPYGRRLNELEFLFPVAGSGTGDLTASRLAAAFGLGTAPLPADYARRIQRLGFAPLQGFLKGFIDLAFEHQGRWYLVDYKSNLLGVRPDDYRASMLIEAMAEHHYFLQYHLYVVALHRYLARRLPGYDYDRHFGGVYYLFVRGMAPHYPRGTGVFYDRPARPLIEDLSTALGGLPG